MQKLTGFWYLDINTTPLWCYGTMLTFLSVAVSAVMWWPFTDERHGTLRLSNLTKSMSGKYTCRASNTAGTDSCSINLEVITCM